MPKAGEVQELEKATNTSYGKTLIYRLVHLNDMRSPAWLEKSGKSGVRAAPSRGSISDRGAFTAFKLAFSGMYYD